MLSTEHNKVTHVAPHLTPRVFGDAQAIGSCHELAPPVQKPVTQGGDIQVSATQSTRASFSNKTLAPRALAQSDNEMFLTQAWI